jgi:hypothetical protein
MNTGPLPFNDSFSPEGCVYLKRVFWYLMLHFKTINFLADDWEQNS